MKKRIAYILVVAVITVAAFFVGRFTSSTKEEIVQKACEYITYWEVTDNGINFYDIDGNAYEWN